MITDVTGWKTSEIEHHLDLREVPKLMQNKITAAIDACNQKKGLVTDGAPCQECGDTQFLRTGTCHTCLTCGTSAGCS